MNKRMIIAFLAVFVGSQLGAFGFNQDLFLKNKSNKAIIIYYIADTQKRTNEKMPAVLLPAGSAQRQDPRQPGNFLAYWDDIKNISKEGVTQGIQASKFGGKFIAIEAVDNDDPSNRQRKELRGIGVTDRFNIITDAHGKVVIQDVS